MMVPANWVDRLQGVQIQPILAGGWHTASQTDPRPKKRQKREEIVAVKVPSLFEYTLISWHLCTDASDISPDAQLWN
jgi:hypothetical protein